MAINVTPVWLSFRNSPPPPLSRESGARRFTLTVPLSKKVCKWVTVSLILETGAERGGGVVTLRLTRCPSVATETGISSGLMGHSARAKS